jgi:peptidoglycan/LPS O-acetylase OafA/YrhL
MTGSAKRIRYLDGLRGIAILIVMGWHYTGPTYTWRLPYDDALTWMPIFNRGWVGVQLFFLISGYVIFLTLERCANLGEFFYRRWLRLFPAMLVASLLLFGISQFLGDYMPDGRAKLIDLVPGLTFISPAFYHAAFDVDIRSIDGVFWTLYIEAGFYVIAGLLYFLVGWRWTIAALVSLAVFTRFAPFVIAQLPPSPLARGIEPFQWIGMHEYGWFAAGALFFKAGELESNRMFWLAFATGFMSVLLNPGAAKTVELMYLIACLLIFAAAQRWAFLQGFLQTRILLFLGLVSYPLYLLHNFLGIGLIAWTATFLPPIVWQFLPIPVAAIIMFLSWLIAQWAEPGIAKILKRQVKRGRAMLPQKAG